MGKERPQRSRLSRVAEVFGLTEREDLWDRVSHSRLEAIIADDRTTVHHIAEDTNSFGEFLFVTVSRPSRFEPLYVTFYGLGYHEQRERWIKDTWSWYEANLFADRQRNVLAKNDVLKAIAERKEAIETEADPQPRSGRAKLFEILADLTDEDGAYTELEDLGDAADWMFDDRGGDNSPSQDE